MSLSWCAQYVHGHDRDRFLLGLFVPEPAREALWALYALNVELIHIHDKVSEEMIGHIRYAWWQESIEEMYAGAPPRSQPVLEALVPLIRMGSLPQEKLMALVDEYRKSFPDMPTEVDNVLDDLSLLIIRALTPQAETGWQKAKGVIARHRKRYGKERQQWLYARLLLAGLF